MTFAERLNQDLMLFDGAMGSYLQSRFGDDPHVRAATSYELLSLSAPDLVRTVHEQYLAAGAEILETNTLCANRINLGLSSASRIKDILRGAVGAAHDAVANATPSRPCFVAGSIGPIVASTQHSDQQRCDAYTEQAEGLLESGVDCLILETFPSFELLLLALTAIKPFLSGLKNRVSLLISLVPPQDYETLPASYWQQLAGKLNDSDADMVGFNCGPSPSAVVFAVAQISPYARVPLLAMPSAGLPAQKDGRWEYHMASAQFVEAVAPMLTSPHLAAIGGCCGTTPDLISHLCRTIRHRSRQITENQ